MFATASDSTDTDKISEFLEESVKGKKTILIPAVNKIYPVKLTYRFQTVFGLVFHNKKHRISYMRSNASSQKVLLKVFA